MGNVVNYVEGLKAEHRKLDVDISILEGRRSTDDQLEIRRLKKRKLALKEQIDKLSPQRQTA